MAEISAGGGIALIGLFLLFFAARASGGSPAAGSQLRFGFSLAQIAPCLAAVLIPAKLIGTCASKNMPCNVVMLPMLLVLGGLAIAVSLANILLLCKDAAGKS